MFHFSRFASQQYFTLVAMIRFTYRVSPFGHHRCNASYRLPCAFRRLVRPSSPSDAKASAMYAFSLSHTPLIASVLPPPQPSISLRSPRSLTSPMVHAHSSFNDFFSPTFLKFSKTLVFFELFVFQLSRFLKNFSEPLGLRGICLASFRLRLMSVVCGFKTHTCELGVSQQNNLCEHRMSETS